MNAIFVAANQLKSPIYRWFFHHSLHSPVGGFSQLDLWDLWDLWDLLIGIEAKCSLDSTNFGDLSCLEEAASGCHDLRGGDGKTTDPKLTSCPRIF